MTTTLGGGDGKFHFAIDRGGTFTDVYCRLPNGDETVSKLLSEDPTHYQDAPTEGIRRILEEHDIDENCNGRSYVRGTPVCTKRIGSIRMGTTVATNALLERAGAATALVITSGFEDILEIGNQSRPDIFDLTCAKQAQLYQSVVGVEERVCLEKFAPAEFTERYESHKGVTGETILVQKQPDLTKVQRDLEQLADAGITSLAIVLMHAYVYPEHERMIGELAQRMGRFEQISLSHQVMPMVKLVSRGQTTTAAAYLTPKITAYLASFISGFDADLCEKVPLQFMKVSKRVCLRYIDLLFVFVTQLTFVCFCCLRYFTVRWGFGTL